MNAEPIFSPADIFLPPLAPNSPDWTKWAVIACDQFTSEPEYWQKAAEIVGNSPSALDLILPEVYLGTDQESSKRRRIAQAMEEYGKSVLHRLNDCLVYLERTLPDGRIRRGLIGKIDLERYDYIPGTTPEIRATEATVLERIPPRVEIRSAAAFELPHVMLLLDDTHGILQSFAQKREKYVPMYDFDLMLDGGHAAGFRMEGDEKEEALRQIADYEHSCTDGLVYAVGDGNHSLAAAKAHYVNLKKILGCDALLHPARYALVELVALQDEALDFEPIYRIVTGLDTVHFADWLAKQTEPGRSMDQTICVLTASKEYEVSFTSPSHALTVGTLQNLLDSYAASYPGIRCDYIHDEASLRKLAARPDSVGFLFDGMTKNELFPYIREHGTLPRKTFSMGEARSKRYYIEARRIIH